MARPLSALLPTCKGGRHRGRLAALALLCASTTACGHLFDNPARMVLPWEKPPPHFNWVISLGAAASFWNEAPRQVTDVFFGLRLGVYIATSGEHHIEPDPDSVITTLGRHTYFRSGIPIIPDNVFISPLAGATGMDVYGVGFRPISFGIHPLGGLVRVGASSGLVVTYAYVGTAVPGARRTHFFQPGIDARIDLELDWGGSGFLSVGWNSLFHTPQRMGGGGPASAASPSLWHLGQGFVLWNIRLPNDSTE